jgi:hypothetical protein
MDNNIKQPNINDTTNFINNTYDPLSYFDLYGNSVIIFIFMTLFVFLVYSYCKIMQTKESIADDWVNQRCKPQNIPFAGFITHPEGTSAFKYTNDNFQYCVQDILKNITSYTLQPFQFMIQTLTKVFSKFSDSIQQTREATNKLRNGIKEFTQDILSRILNVMIPIQTMFIALSDTFQKIQGVMTGGLYTMLGSYYTLQALMGAILELIIKVLVTLVVIIVGLWIMPFTWPAAASMTAVFLAISIPLTIIIYFMTEVLHIKSSGIPKLRCFDRKTRIYLQDGSFKYIEDVKVNDILQDYSIVTAKIKVTSDELDMYNLNGVIVSESHIVKCCNKWIPVKYHPLAIKIHNYNEPYLYCLNTTTKTIVLNNIIFTDWDEVYDYNLEFICKFMQNKNLSRIDEGYEKNTKIKLKNQEVFLKDIKIGDFLSTEGIVYGIVELNYSRNLGNKEPLYNLLVSNGIFQSGSLTFSDYNKNIDSILDLKKILSKEYV